jgi:hypothetical protein
MIEVGMKLLMEDFVKKTICVMICFNVISFLFATELWNGFTTDMSKEQVYAKVLELFEESSTGHHYTSRSKSIGHHYQSGPVDDSLLINTNNSAFPTLVFYFRNNKLYVIEVMWGSDTETLLGRHRNQFGNPVETKASDATYNSGISWVGKNGYYTVTKRDYKWQNSERYIFLCTTIYPSNLSTDVKRSLPNSCFIDRFVYDAWQEQLNKEQRQRDETESKRKRNASEGITF